VRRTGNTELPVKTLTFKVSDDEARLIRGAQFVTLDTGIPEALLLSRA